MTVFVQIFIINGTLDGEMPGRGGCEMDIKKMIADLVEKITKDEKLMKKFQKDAVATVEELIGMDLPNDQIEKLVEGIQAKISLDKIGGMLGGLFGKK